MLWNSSRSYKHTTTNNLRYTSTDGKTTAKTIHLAYRSACPDGITYEEINSKWHGATLNEDGKDYAWRTFREDRRIIAEEFERQA